MYQAMVDPGRFFQGVLGQQPSTPEHSTGQQHIVMKVHVVVSWLQFPDRSNNQ